ncbi:MAG: site-2 protease family protein [Gammaproteobacteria bacterium]|nr:MAG: site-2 protease family protein [Gammaproteobacteria bacterium]
MEELTAIQRIATWALPVLFAITVHEVAHGWVARRLGDPTAFMLGRLTLNPVKHIDPVGTVLVPLALLMIGGFVFGWAKPVPVTWENLRHPKRDMALVAAAGPVANLVMALLWAGAMKIGMLLAGTADAIAIPLLYMGAAGIMINLVLMVLNLLPLPPLDGGRVVAGLLPDRLSWQFSRLEPYGLMILLAMLFFGLLGDVLRPPVVLLQGLIFSMLGL